MVKKKGIKPNAAEVQDRVDAVRSMIAQGYRKGAIKEFGCKQWNVHWRTIDNYIARAREDLLAEAGTDREQLRAESLAFYREIQVSNDAQVQDKIKARERIDKLFALEQIQTFKHEHSGNLGVQHSGVLVVESAPQTSEEWEREGD